MIEQITVGALGVNTYFVIDEKTKEGIVIDPGAQAERILDKIKDNEWEIKLILLTHGHYDHIGAAQEIKKELGCDIIAHENAREYLEDAEINLSTVFGGVKVELEADKYITEDRASYEDLLKVLPDELSFQVLHAPGHTTDSILFYFKNYNAAIVGDVIFRESIGRADLYGGNITTLINSIKTKVFTLEDDTVLYPGHGPATTVIHEKNNNPYFNMDF
ncbi:MAG: MBL fold metallo-hydrolase [Epulopiscium sp.]|nr:MBL fold metallo-hydrolase [Candidatus Epulonipiscium sp.]